jgi:hypothetical protein
MIMTGRRWRKNDKKDDKDDMVIAMAMIVIT